MMKKSLLLTILLLNAVFIGTAWGQTTLTVCDGTDTNEYVPFQGEYNDSNGTTTEFVIPSVFLTSMEVGSRITSITFYLDEDYHGSLDDNLDATWQIYMCEISDNTLDGIVWPEGRVLVYEGSLDATQLEMTISFNNTYTYNGGNLLICTYILEGGGGYPFVLFYGIEDEEQLEKASYHYNAWTSGSEDFIPKTTFTYVSPAVSCITPTSVNISDVAKTSATVSWTSESGNFNIKYKKTADPDVTGNWGTTTSTTTSCLLEDLDSETEYEVQVQAVCSATSQSDWTSSVTFTTMEAHPIPTNLNVTNITNSSALISWTGYDESYTLAYRNSPYFIKEGFEGGTLPTGWSCTGSNAWKVGYGDDSGITQPHSGNYNAKRNNGGSYDYLITPEMDLSHVSNVYLSCYYINRDEYTNEEYKHDFFGIYYRINGGSWIELFYTEDAHDEWIHYTIASLPNLADHYQIGFRYCANFGCGVALDDIVVGITGSDPSWNTENNNVTNEYLDLSGLGAGTYYEVKVKNNFRDDYSDTYVFNTLPKVYTTTSDWGDMTVTSIDNVRINAAVTIPDGTIATANNITLDTGGSITIAEGGQLVCNNSVEVTAKMNIDGATTKDDVYGWYTISSPVNNIAISSMTDLLSNEYDLYRYDEETMMWENYKSTDPVHTGFSVSQNDSKFENGRGYLYRNTDDVEIQFTGNTNVGDVVYSLSYTDVNKLDGVHLIGNPYPHSITKGDGKAIDNDKLSEGFYTLNVDQDAWYAHTDGDEIEAMQGILVQTTEELTDFTIKDINYVASAKSSNDNIIFTVENQKYSDIAYAMFDKGHGLNKIEHRNQAVPMLYISQNDENYSIAMMNDDTKVINLGFEAKTIGKYTLSLKANGNFSYLHLIDKLTGEEVDMLVGGEYSFMGSPSDDNNRFIVKLEYSDNSEISETFAYQSGNDIVVTGEGELQIFDVMGRMVKTRHINGVETINVKSQGVYIFRLNEKTQKMIIK